MPPGSSGRPASWVVTVGEETLAFVGTAFPADGTIADPQVDPSVALAFDLDIQDHANRVTGEGAALARSLGIDAEPLAVPREREVAATVLAVARERQAAAIVVGSRGLSGIRARLEGSTYKAILKHAACPVIVVHEPDEGATES